MSISVPFLSSALTSSVMVLPPSSCPFSSTCPSALITFNFLPSIILSSSSVAAIFLSNTRLIRSSSNNVILSMSLLISCLSSKGTASVPSLFCAFSELSVFSAYSIPAIPAEFSVLTAFSKLHTPSLAATLLTFSMFPVFSVFPAFSVILLLSDTVPSIMLKHHNRTAPYQYVRTDRIQELYFHYIVITQQYTLVWYTLPAYQLSC